MKGDRMGSLKAQCGDNMRLGILLIAGHKSNMRFHTMSGLLLQGIMC